MRRGGASRNIVAAFCCKLPYGIQRVLFILLPQFDIITLQRKFNEAVDRLAGPAGECMGQFTGLAAADGKLGFGHGVPLQMVAST